MVTIPPSVPKIIPWVWRCAFGIGVTFLWEQVLQSGDGWVWGCWMRLGQPKHPVWVLTPGFLLGTPNCTHHPHPVPAQSAGSPPVTTSPTNTGSQMWMRKRSSSEPSRHGQGECAALLRVMGLWALCCSQSYTHNRAWNPTGKSGANSSPVATALSDQSASTCTSSLPAGRGGTDGGRGCPQ